MQSFTQVDIQRLIKPDCKQERELIIDTLLKTKESHVLTQFLTDLHIERIKQQWKERISYRQKA